MFADGVGNTPGASGVAVVKKGAITYNLIYKAAKAGDVKVSILNSKHEVVFNESIRTSDGFSRPYNFESLEEGDYSTEVVDDTGMQIEKIHNYVNKTKKLFHITKLSDQNKYVLSVAGKGDETIHVKIYDGATAVVYDEDKSISGDFAEVFNLKNSKGTITFEITGENGEAITLYY